MAPSPTVTVAIFAGIILILIMGAILYTQPKPPPPEQLKCADGRNVTTLADCPEFQKYRCPNGTIVNNASECAPACSQATLEQLLAAKSHTTAPELTDAANAALLAFNASDDSESSFFRYQIALNEGNATISHPESRDMEKAVALYGLVRGMQGSTRPADLRVTRDDLTVLVSGAGRPDEKALLLRSLYASAGLRARILTPANDACSGTPCDCLMQPSRVFVAVRLPAFPRFQIYPNGYYGGPFASCLLADNYLVVDPSCADCMFAFGYNCTGAQFRTLLGD